MFRQKRRAVARSGLEVEAHVSYPFQLNLYNDAPDTEITIDEFEQWAIARLTVLGELDRLLALKEDDLNNKMWKKLQEYLPLGSASARRSTGADRRRDHYSHYILRLAFCRNAELRAKFIRLETMLFKIRYQMTDLKDRRAFVEGLDLAMDPVFPEERARYESELLAAAGGKPTEGTYFKVHFTRVPDLVEYRRVFLRDGMAYVPEGHQLSLIVSEYAEQLEKSLDKLSRALPRLEEGQRLSPLLERLATGFNLTSYEVDKNEDGRVNADTIDSLDKAGHFPMCMSTMHRSLMVRKHAHYDSRTFYTRFLRYVGLSVEEALRFWKRAFVNLADDKFDKEYAYNIKHQYGLVGGRINYKAPTCLEIVNKVPTQKDHSHGCPYKYMSPDRLEESLRARGVTDKSDLAEVRRLCDSTKFDLACSRVFDITHPQAKDGTERMTHPNMYFTKSWDLAQEPVLEALEKSSK